MSGGGAFEDEKQLLISFSILGAVLLAIFLLPILLLYTSPFIVAWIVYMRWSKSPARLEASDRDQNQAYYDKVVAGTLAKFSDEDIKYYLSLHLRGNLAPDAEAHLLDIGKRLIRELDLVTTVPPPPAVATAIESGRYRDRLAKIGTRSPEQVKEALDYVAKLIGEVSFLYIEPQQGGTLVPVRAFIPKLEEVVQEICEMIQEQDYLRDVARQLNENLQVMKGVQPKDYKGDEPVEEVYFAHTPLRWLFDWEVPFAIPTAMRTEHMQVVASPGHGKSTLFTQMFFEDLKTDSAIVVIDSQNDLISQLAQRVPLDRLILVDPKHCPPPLNIFAQAVDGQRGISNALALFEYVFASLGVAMTGKQEMMYRYLSRLCMMVPSGNIVTLCKMLRPNGTDDYLEYIEQMDENGIWFFESYRQPKNNEFASTRQEVLIRLLKVLENPAFNAMLGADRMAIDIPKALDEGKVILVSTNKNEQDKGAALLGRIFIAQVMQAVRNRAPGFRRRVYLYVDEFADYAEDSDILLDCFAQGRKYELGVIVAHQNLDQLTPQLSASISSNTAIKFAGGVSDKDARTLAGQMRTTASRVDGQPKGSFLAYFKDMGTFPWPVQFGFIDTVETEQDLDVVHKHMRTLYGTNQARPTSSPARKAPPAPEPPEPDQW